MVRPTTMPEWATTDVTLPQAAIPNKSQPTQNLRDVGFDLLSLPEAQEENFWRNLVYLWVAHFDGVIGSATSLPQGREVATQLQATTGTDNTTIMTPLRVAQTQGTAAPLDVGTGASNVPQLDSQGRYPAIDGSQITNLPATPPSASTGIGAVTLALPTNSAAMSVGTIRAGSGLRYTDTAASPNGTIINVGTWRLDGQIVLAGHGSIWTRIS